MLRERVLILFLIFVHLHDTSCVIDSLHDTGEEIWKLYSMINKTELNTTSAFEELFIGENGSNGEIQKQLLEINKQIDEFGESMSFGTCRESLKLLPSYIMLSRDVDLMEIFVKIIDTYYAEFYRFIAGDILYSDEKFRDFTQRMTLNVEGAIQVLRKTLADEEESTGWKNLVSLIGDYAISQRAEICNGPQIISSILVELFKTVMLAEMKSNLMLSITNIYQYIGDTAGWKQMNSLSRTQFKRQFGIYVNLFATNLIKSDPSYLRACDPENGTWTRDDSFYELEGTIQATIFRYHWPPCKFSSCNVISSEKAGLCQAAFYNNRSACQNTLADCTLLKAVEACQLKTGPHKFKYVDSMTLGFLGRDSECPKDNGHMIRDGTDWSLTHRVCACSCYENHNKISLAFIESNVDENMIITGIRFLWQNEILHIQPREGKLCNDGRIKKYSERWVSIPKSSKASDIHPVDKMNRVFFLDDLYLPWRYVLTGVKFNKVKRNNVKGFAIEISGSSFNYKSGRITSEQRYRISRPVPHENPWMPLSFTAVSSVYTNLTHSVSPGNKKYVSLERSTLQDDFGQSTLPLFDAIPIRANPPSPLGGIGVFHKYAEGYAGLIALRVYGINYADYFSKFKSEHLDDSGKFDHAYDHPRWK